MKRIIQCPHCETKLSVFDIGKPISQKCPKCGKAINVASEAASSGGQNGDKTAPAAATYRAANQSRTADKPAGDGNAPEAKANGTADKSSNQAQPSTNPARPPATSEAEAMPSHEQPGYGGFFKAFVIGALIIIIAMQMIAKLKSDKQYNRLNANIKTIANKLGN